MATQSRAPRPPVKRQRGRTVQRAEDDGLQGDLVGPGASGILAMQHSLGNRQTQRLIRQHHAAQPVALQRAFPSPVSSVQRDDPDPQPAQTGWTGKDVKSTSENAKPRLIGKVWRIPIEGLKGVGNQAEALDAKDFLTKTKTKEEADGRAIVLIPEGLRKKDEIEVLLHLHGHGLGYREFTVGGKPQVRDEAIDQTESQLEVIFASGRNMIAVLPQGTGTSGFGAGFDADKYLRAAFKILGERGNLPKGKKPGPVVFSGHSGGGDVISPMLAEDLDQEKRAKKAKTDKGATRLPDNMRELILFDALHGSEDQTLIEFLTARLNHDLAELTNAERSHWPAAHRTYLATSFRFRGYHSGGSGNDRGDGKDNRSGYGRRYDNVKKALDQWFAVHKDILGGPGEVAYDGLQANYQVIDTGRPGTNPGHERMMGEERLFEKTLKRSPATIQPDRVSQFAQPSAVAGPAIARKVTIPADAIPAGRLGGYGSAEATRFRRAVYQKMLERSAVDPDKSFTIGPGEEDLEEVESGFKMHTVAAADCATLLARARHDRDERKMFAKYKKPRDRTAGDKLVIAAGDISIASAHRGLDDDFGAWRNTFGTYFERTKDARAALTGGEFGAAAVNLMVDEMYPIKASPGYSNHTKGLAVDFSTTQGGTPLGPNTSQKDAWTNSWFYHWLVANAADHHFTQLPTEEWHWDHDPPT
ncbi:MAG TPA: M15 family metallopeptidase [Thermomicrobiales bacterium]|nr:M15 family metallopeptidase [Thermomicrobiales bacterium]